VGTRTRREKADNRHTVNNRRQTRRRRKRVKRPLQRIVAEKGQFLARLLHMNVIADSPGIVQEEVKEVEADPREARVQPKSVAVGGRVLQFDRHLLPIDHGLLPAVDLLGVSHGVRHGPAGTELHLKIASRALDFEVWM
jgi:hypothetical protein